MNADIIDQIEKDFPDLHQLLVRLLVSQYVSEPVPLALRDYAATTPPARRAATLRQLDAAAALLIANYERMSEFTNYHLDSPEDARALLSELRQGLLAMAETDE